MIRVGDGLRGCLSLWQPKTNGAFFFLLLLLLLLTDWKELNSKNNKNKNKTKNSPEVKLGEGDSD